MGILGLTHDENGAALEKLPVTIKVAIGKGRHPMMRTVVRERFFTSFSSGELCADKWCIGNLRQI